MSAIRVDRFVLREIEIPLKQPFVSFNSRETARRLVIVEAHLDGLIGYGEASPLSAPTYTEETPQTVWHILSDFLIPLCERVRWQHPTELARHFETIRRHHMAKAALEGALWDLWCKTRGISLSQGLGSQRDFVPSGIAIGLTSTIDELLARVEKALAAGYHRIKVKIKPGWDLVPIRELRNRFGQFPLMVDANSAYSLDDIPHLQRLDEFQLMMIEQPLSATDIIDHAALQKQLATPLCLDESIETVDDIRHALTLGSCRIVNIKAGRVGGLTRAVQIHDLCQAHDVPVWCGGLLESGIGRAHNVALASLPNFTIPGDLSPSDRYFHQDVIHPEFTLDEKGCLKVPDAPGIGVEVDTDYLSYLTRRKAVLTP